MRIVVNEVPPAVLFPNAARSSSFYRVAEAAAPLRASAKWEAVKAAMDVRSVNGGAIFAGPVTVRVCVCWPKGRRMPDCEALALAAKPILDGFCDAAIYVNDSQIKQICYSQARSDDRIGRVEVDIEEAGDGA